MSEFHKRIAPDYLYREGFNGNNSRTALNQNNVLIAREYIKKHWKRTKKLNRHHTSLTLATHISKKLGIEIANGELIAAAILEGHGFEQSQINALFYADTDLQKPKFKT